jgi:hypothetical protein
MSDTSSDASELIEELSSLSVRMGALLQVAQGIIDDGVNIDDGYHDNSVESIDQADHWMDDVLMVDDDDGHVDISPPRRTRGDVRFNDVVEIIQPRDIFNTPPLRQISGVFRTNRLRSPPPLLRRQYSFDDGYDSDASTIVEEWVDPAISPMLSFFFDLDDDNEL